MARGGAKARGRNGADQPGGRAAGAGAAGLHHEPGRAGLRAWPRGGGQLGRLPDRRSRASAVRAGGAEAPDARPGRRRPDPQRASHAGGGGHAADQRRRRGGGAGQRMDDQAGTGGGGARALAVPRREPGCGAHVRRVHALCVPRQRGPARRGRRGVRGRGLGAGEGRLSRARRSLAAEPAGRADPRAQDREPARARALRGEPRRAGDRVRRVGARRHGHVLWP